jgi:type VI secretion system protein ImpC
MLPKKSNFEAKVSLEREGVPIPEDPPFHLLVAGDFSGRANLLHSTEATLNTPKPIEIDRDNFEDVMKRLNVGLRIRTGETGFLPLVFRELDDFHPDRIFAQVPLFEELRDVRRRLMSERSYDEAAREVRGWLDQDDEPVREADPPEAVPDRPLQTGSLLEDILGSTKRAAAAYPAQSADRSELSELVRELVRPHLISTDEAEQAKLVSVVDEMTGDLMRKIVHDPEFMDLEASWRGLYLLVRSTETGKDLKIFLYDISKDELSADLKNVSDLSDSNYFETVVHNASGSGPGEPWAMICGNFAFSLNVDDAATLIRLGKISGAVKAPFVSHIRPQMLGIESLATNPLPSDWNLRDETEAAKLWTMLRTVPEAVNLGLVVPRFLARLPYGEDTDPTETFSFQELTGERRHDQYLWANPAFICGLLVAKSFNASGWEIGGRFFLDVEGLPTHVYREDGDTVTKPCAEIAMTHEACDTLLEQGLMPLISFKDTDRVRIGGLQSISYPPKDLNGRWG